MIGSDRYHDARPDPGDERSGDRLRFADLGDFYPAQSPPAQTVNGTQPAAPQNATGSATVSATAPASVLIGAIALALVLLHWGG